MTDVNAAPEAEALAVEHVDAHEAPEPPAAVERQRYAHVDANGVIDGFYDQDHQNLPKDAFPITDELWLEWIQKGHTVRWTGKALEDLPQVPLVETGPRRASGRQLRYALNAKGWRQAWDEAVAASKKPDDVDYWTTLGSGDLAPEDNPKLARIATASGVDLHVLFDAALAASPGP